jgi:pyruvate kinase
MAQICAKLETAQSLDNLEAIVMETDSVMVARGDLGVETPLEQVPLHQKRMIETCLRYGKTVITATQMMASMEQNAFPTRAEVSDVANAILDRTDAIMLSGESASGKFPAETVAMMTRIAQATEACGNPYMRVVTKPCRAAFIKLSII